MNWRPQNTNWEDPNLWWTIICKNSWKTDFEKSFTYIIWLKKRLSLHLQNICKCLLHVYKNAEYELSTEIQKRHYYHSEIDGASRPKNGMTNSPFMNSLTYTQKRSQKSFTILKLTNWWS